MATPETDAKRRRRALSHVGGKVEITGGSAEERRALERALAVDPDERSTMAHVHGFHSYPAKLHPETAARLIEDFSKPGGVVLDPFCGSGTVLVEALLCGRRALGVDANPLAIELSWLKTSAARSSWILKLQGSADKVVEHAEARRARKAGPTRRYGAEDRKLFAVHVLLELDGLSDGIARLPDEKERRALGLVLSSILTKVSTKAGDSSGRLETKRLAGGYTIRLFSRKVSELVQRATEFQALLPERLLAPALALGDARRLEIASSGSVDLVVSSPPYAGVYDYFEHHRLRLRWLGLPEAPFERAEIGSRRQARAERETALPRFGRDFSECLGELARVMKDKGRAALVVADSVLAGRPLYADDLLRTLAPDAGLSVIAVASQQRPHFHEPTRAAFRRRPRSEHLILLGKEPSSTKARATRRGPPERDRPRDARGR